MTICFFNETAFADKVGFAISMLIVLLILVGFEIKNWWENLK